MTSPPDDGAGGRRAMEMAIRQANLAPEQIGHLNAHATISNGFGFGGVNASLVFRRLDRPT